MKRSISKALWDSKEIVKDLINCIEFLEQDCVLIFDAMTRDEIVYILSKSATIYKNLEYFLNKQSYEQMNGKMRFFKSCLRRF